MTTSGTCGDAVPIAELGAEEAASERIVCLRVSRWKRRETIMPNSKKKPVQNRLAKEQAVARFSARTGLSKLAVLELFRRFGPRWARHVDFRIES